MSKKKNRDCMKPTRRLAIQVEVSCKGGWRGCFNTMDTICLFIDITSQSHIYFASMQILSRSCVMTQYGRQGFISMALFKNCINAIFWRVDLQSKQVARSRLATYVNRWT